MCHSHGLVFHNKSLNMGPIYGEHLKIVKNRFIFWEKKFLKMGTFGLSFSCKLTYIVKQNWSCPVWLGSATALFVISIWYLLVATNGEIQIISLQNCHDGIPGLGRVKGHMNNDSSRIQVAIILPYKVMLALPLLFFIRPVMSRGCEWHAESITRWSFHGRDYQNLIKSQKSIE